MNDRNNQRRYKDFLKIVSKHFSIARLMDGEDENKRCFLRHDVDYHFAGSLVMAQIEKDLQICSTYFMLHTAPYYKKIDFLEKCNLIQDMGHEIGFHNNIIEACIVEPRSSYKEILERELRFLREGGLRIYGTASHGSVNARKMVFANYQIFKECQRPHLSKHLVGLPPLHTLSLKEYELYEAYFLPIPSDCYVTDTGNHWRYTCREGEDEWHPKYLGMEVKKNIKETIQDLGERDDVKNIQLLTHPCWWGFQK